MAHEWIFDDGTCAWLGVELAREGADATPVVLAVVAALAPFVFDGAMDAQLASSLQAPSLARSTLKAALAGALERGKGSLRRPLAAGSLCAVVGRLADGPISADAFWQGCLFVPGPLYMAVMRAANGGASRVDMVAAASRAARAAAVPVGQR